MMDFALTSMPLLYAGAFVLGAMIGSFLNVVILRLPALLEYDWRSQCRELLGQEGSEEKPPGLVMSRSKCPHCGHRIRAHENIPIVSWLLLRGRCSACGERISLRYPLVELLTALLFLVTVWHFGPTNWEGGYRVPLAVKWPGVIEPDQVSNEIISHMDWIPTIMAAVGEPEIKEELMAGKNVDGKNFRVHLDGYNFLPYFSGEEEEGPRREFFYFSDTGDLLNLRYNDWKVVFAEQRAHGMEVWQDPFTFLRMPKIFNLRMDPFEIADQLAIGYPKWRFDRLFLLVPAQAFVGDFLGTFVEYPPRQKPGSFSIDQVLESLQKAGTQ